MSLEGVTRAGVLKAIAECDQLGRTHFLQRHGFGRSTGYVLVHNGREYDSKAIVGVAHGYDQPSVGALSSAEFDDGKNSVEPLLIRLGFYVQERPAAREPKPAAWDDEDLLLVLDLYLREGPLDAAEPHVVELARQLSRRYLPTQQNHSRSADAVAAKLLCFAALDPSFGGLIRTTPEGSYARIWSAYAGDEDALRAAVERILSGQAPACAQPPAASRIRLVPMEAANKESFAVRRWTNTSVAARREESLLRDYATHLAGQSHSCRRAIYDGSGITLCCDLIDETEGVLYEAKGSIDRESLRIAVGQLFDYRRFHPDPKPAIAVLLPREPGGELIAYLQSIPVRVVYREKDAWPSIAGASEAVRALP